MKPTAIFFLLFAGSMSALPPVERMPYRAAVNEANAWNDGIGERVFVPVGLTGSMKPYLMGNEWALMEKYHDQKIEEHDLIAVHRWDKPQGVMHEVTAVSKKRVKTQGINCMDSDGWQDKERIMYIVRRVIAIDWSKT